MKIKWKRKKKSGQQPSVHAQQIEDHCKQAWSFLKKNPGGKFFGIIPRPWILLLGTPQSGRTTLLKGSDLSLTSSHNVSLDLQESTKLVDWWVSKEAVFIDPTSDIVLPSNSIEQTRWETLLDIIDGFRLTRPVNQVLLVIDFPSLKNLPKETTDELSSQLLSVQKLSKIIPVSIVISQCDHLPGFEAMFDDFDTEQREQILGVHFTSADRKKGLPKVFNHAFSQILERIKSRLIHRLHREQSLAKRRQIHQFPSNFAAISKPIETLISNLPFNSSIPLHGIYFTSLSHHRPYFMKDMMKLIIEKSSEPLPAIKKHALDRLLALPITAAIVLAFTICWHFGYNQTIHTIDKIQEELAATPNHIPPDTPWLAQLNTLGNVLQTIENQQIIPTPWFGLLQTLKMQSIAQKQYQHLLALQFTPFIKSILINQIQLGIKGDKLALFDALKTYLSLSESDHYNKSTAINWFRIYWEAKHPNQPQLLTQLEYHLSKLLESGKTLWQPDPGMVQLAQNALQKTSLDELAFLELQGEYESNSVPIFSNGDLEGISLKKATVPVFFSKANYQDIFKNKIPAINDMLAKGNWVLGTTSGPQITAKQQTEIAQKVRKKYLNYFSNVWAESIAQIQLKPADNYSEVLQRINLITDPKSGLTRLLNRVIQNASLNGGVTNKNLTAVKNYLNKKGQYTSIHTALENVKIMIQSIQKTNHPNKSSFAMARNRFQRGGIGDPITQIFTEANKNPEPIRSWLNTIAQSTWKTMLKQSRVYLNTVWKNIVLPVYYSEIENRYPIFKEASDDISIKNFNDFFGPNGTVGAFFIYYLQNFVDTSKNYWTWKSLNGANLNISQKTLNTFIRASIIQQMFFTDNKNTPSFRFILAPIKLSSNSKKFTINLGGQIYNVRQNTLRSTKQFRWPGPDTSFATVQFVENNGNNPTETYNGPWAWFRLLDANTLQTTGNPEQFTLTIQSNSSSASFKLIADHRINPMVPGVIGKYRCPDKL